MARSFLSTVIAINRAQAAAARRAEAAQRRELRNELSRLRAQAKQQKQDYIQARVSQTDDLNKEILDRVEAIRTLVSEAVTLRLDLPFEVKRQDPAKEIADFWRANPLFAPSLNLPEPLGVFSALLPWVRARHEADTREAHHQFKSKQAAYDVSKEQLETRAAALKERIIASNSELDQQGLKFTAGDPSIVSECIEGVLLESNCEFVQSVAASFSNDSGLLVLEADALALDDVVPTAESFTYKKTTDEIVEKVRSQKSVKSLYLEYISKLALRLAHLVFNLKPAVDIVQTVALNLFSNSVDRATGCDVRPCLLSVTITRDQFSILNLGRLDPILCLKQLQATVSRDPSELVPVKPISRLNLHDRRFIEEADVLAGMRTEKNLMELTPSEFESLITNLFGKMGLETRLTQASRDGGVDCVAFDLRPVLGGKVIIQAKRYKNTVGVSAVRDLFGTVHNEGASKGILVSTSGYGKAAYEFAAGKPLELIDGSELLYLLLQHAGVAAKIEMPDDWVDQTP